tara:strand:- start:1372 stop:2094 length:723 start_codon:yes stop_codon:yes gene_type:complete
MATTTTNNSPLAPGDNQGLFNMATTSPRTDTTPAIPTAIPTASPPAVSSPLPPAAAAVLFKMAATISEKHPSISMEKALETAREMEPLLRNMSSSGTSATTSSKPKKTVKRGKNAYMYFLGANRQAIKEDLNKVVDALKEIISSGTTIALDSFPDKYGGPNGEMAAACKCDKYAGSIYTRCHDMYSVEGKSLDDLKVTVTDVTKRAGQKWKELDEAGKKPFNDMAAAEKAKLAAVAVMDE